MFRTIVHIICFLALAALFGGILFFGAGVASVVFQPDLLPSRTLAGAVNAAVLHRLNVLEGVCAAILPLALGYLAFTTPRSASRIAFGLSIAILITVLYLGLKLFPEVNALRLEISDFDHVLAMKQELLDRFHELHTRYSRLTQGILIATLIILIWQVILLSRTPRAKEKGREAKVISTPEPPKSEPMKEKVVEAEKTAQVIREPEKPKVEESSKRDGRPGSV